MKKVYLIISIIAIVTLISGCNQPNPTYTQVQENSTTRSTTPTTSYNIEIKNNAFLPDSITVKQGQSVTWTNNDNVAHTVTSVTGEFNSDSIQPGSTFTYKFDKSGSYEYSCTIHPGMIHGKITVT